MIDRLATRTGRAVAIAAAAVTAIWLIAPIAYQMATGHPVALFVTRSIG